MFNTTKNALLYHKDALGLNICATCSAVCYLISLSAAHFNDFSDRNMDERCCRCYVELTIISECKIKGIFLSE